MFSECGGTFATPIGLIDFPHGEGTVYDHDLTCIYTISVEPGKVVALNFLQFNLEPSPYCSYDWLAVSFGHGSSRICSISQSQDCFLISERDPHQFEFPHF